MSADLQNISLARGAPSLDIVAVDDLRQAADRAFARDPGAMVAYGTSAGHPALVAWIAEKHGVAPEQVIATNGSMQADAFLFKRLVEPGDVVVVEAPSYDRTLLSLRELGAELLAIPLEDDGLDVEALAARARGRRPPEAGPRHSQLPQPRRLHALAREAPRLLELAAEYEFTLFEDDPYVDIRFAGEPLPTMFSLDQQRGRRVRVLVLEDRLPRHPGGLPRGPGGADRRDPRASRPTPTSRRTW